MVRIRIWIPVPRFHEDKFHGNDSALIIRHHLANVFLVAFGNGRIPPLFAGGIAGFPAVKIILAAFSFAEFFAAGDHKSFAGGFSGF